MSSELDRALLNLEEQHGRPARAYHVLWIVETNLSTGLFTDRSRMLDIVELGHPTLKDAHPTSSSSQDVVPADRREKTPRATSSRYTPGKCPYRTCRRIIREAWRRA